MLNKLKIILTAVGCPGAVTMIRALQANGEREIEIVGLDMRPNAAGRFFVDKFYTVPAGSDPAFIPRMLEIVKKEQPQIILPQSSFEIPALSQNRAEFQALGALLVLGDPHSVEHGGDKWLTYQAIKESQVPLPKSILVKSVAEFEAAIKTLGYPEKKVCFKPPFSKGTRGFRIITAQASRLHLLLEAKPDSLLMTLDEAIDILSEAEQFPDLMVMEFAEGKEYTVDIFCRKGQTLMGFVKTREAIRSGLAMYFETVDRPDLWEYGKTIVERLQLDYFVNIQFKGDKLLEVNPRVSTFVHQEDFNMPYLGLKYMLNELSADDLRRESKKARPTRRTVRYYDQVFYDAPLLNN